MDAMRLKIGDEINIATMPGILKGRLSPLWTVGRIQLFYRKQQRKGDSAGFGCGQHGALLPKIGSSIISGFERQTVFHIELYEALKK